MFLLLIDTHPRSLIPGLDPHSLPLFIPPMFVFLLRVVAFLSLRFVSHHAHRLPPSRCSYSLLRFEVYLNKHFFLLQNTPSSFLPLFSFVTALFPSRRSKRGSDSLARTLQTRRRAERASCTTRTEKERRKGERNDDVVGGLTRREQEEDGEGGEVSRYW